METDFQLSILTSIILELKQQTGKNMCSAVIKGYTSVVAANSVQFTEAGSSCIWLITIGISLSPNYLINSVDKTKYLSPLPH